MASDETMTFQSCSQDEDLDDDMEDGYDHHRHPHAHNLSRLSVCTSSTLCGVDDEEHEHVDVVDDDDEDDALTMYVSHLSMESLEEFPDGKEAPTRLSSDSETEFGSFYSFPATPSRQRNRVRLMGEVNYYSSDNETEKGESMGSSHSLQRRWRSGRVKSEDGEKVRNNKEEKEEEHVEESNRSVGGGGGGGGGEGRGVMVITRPKGGRRSLCMDMEEVKACRELGFELEHERTLEVQVPSPLSLDCTNSGGNSPISNWRISSPGDDPRDVKARLKVWAQAVAIASASKYCN